MPKVEIFIGVTVENEDGSEDRYSETGTLHEAASPVKMAAALGMRVLKKILEDMRSKR